VQQPGVEVRPLKQMTGNATFNEVFFTDARVANADLIGRPGDGWAAASAGGTPGGRAGSGSHARRWMAATAEVAAGKSPGPTSSTTKLFRSNLVRLNRDLGPEIVGAYGMLAGDDAPHGGAVTRATLQAPADSIAGGTDEVQHNIIGERVLGLPREPDTDRDIPYRDLKVGTQR